MLQTPLHFNPLRPSRNQLRGVTQLQDTPSSRAPFAYLHNPYRADSTEEYVTVEQMGTYNRDTQMWEFPNGQFDMGVQTKTRVGQPKSPPTASLPGEQPDYDYVTDDHCS